ncbi:MAG: hypothetical protein HGB08_00390 [Candidatus Moranbacteria bacterium]|nr:hypothetical protein [Candidatus Moranbacteria bacterium]
MQVELTVFKDSTGSITGFRIKLPRDACPEDKSALGALSQVIGNQPNIAAEKIGAGFVDFCTL